MQRDQVEIPWPRPEDKLFVSGGQGNLAGHLLNPIAGFPSELGITAAGYKAAADVLIEWIENNPRDDSLVSPILFCYRQYVELKLKDITLIINAFNETDEGYQWGHDLQRLWITLISKMDLRIDDDRQTLAVVDEYITQLSNVDPRGTKFRYLDEPLPFHQIDLGNLREAMGKLASFLDSLADYWEAELYPS